MAKSNIIVLVHDIDNYVSQGHELITEILLCIAVINERKFVLDDNINMLNCDDYNSLSHNTQSANTREIKQHSDVWLDRRLLAKVTGSTLYSAVGMDSLAKQREHLETFVCGLTQKPIAENV